MLWTDVVGYLASFLIALSLTMSNIWRLRWVSLGGSITMAIYGLLIGSFPVILLNFFVAGTNVFYLVCMSRKKDYFTLLKVSRSNRDFLPRFLAFYDLDLKQHYPNFVPAWLESCDVYFILRNMVSVGLFAYRPRSDGVVEIVVDYVIPDYRDLKNAWFVYAYQKAVLFSDGDQRFETLGSTPVHRKYLRRVGFKPDANDPTRFWKEI